jgi:glycosyltransferase involved in cell wall biosynthesis
MYPRDYPAPDFEEDHGVQITRLRRKKFRMSWLHARYRLYRMISRWSREGSIDIVEIPDWEGWGAGWPKLPVPAVTRLHGSSTYFAAEMNRTIRRRTFWIERAALRRANYWCSVSRYTADKTRAVFDLKSSAAAVLYNSVDVPGDEIDFASRSANKVVYAGTLTTKKGVVSLIRAWPQVLSRHPRAELHMFGKDGRTDNGQSMQEYLLSKLEGAARRSVFFHGHISRIDLAQELQTARLAVFPSYAEAFALAPLEAMAHGCPTIYSRRGSGPELIDDGEHGLLVDPDCVDEIAAHITQLLGDDGLASRLGEAGRRRVAERFSTQQMLARNEAFYERCVEDFCGVPSRQRTGDVL